MSWHMPWKPADENTRTCWGYSFQWTQDHLSADEMHKLKFTYDELADECLARLDHISPPSDGTLPRNSSIPSAKAKDGTSVAPPLKRDLYILLRDHASTDEKLAQLWKEANTIPEWVDWQQIQRGQDVFYRYGGAALTGLAYQSLLGGMVCRSDIIDQFILGQHTDHTGLGGKPCRGDPGTNRRLLDQGCQAQVI